MTSTTNSHPALLRVAAFADAHQLRVPVLLGPMAGACPASLSIAVANAGGLGSCGALLLQPAAIKAWAAEMRAGSNGAFALNLWIPDPKPHRDQAKEDALRAFLREWGPEVSPTLVHKMYPAGSGDASHEWPLTGPFSFGDLNRQVNPTPVQSPD